MSTVTVSRARLGLSPLDLNSGTGPGGISLVEYEPGVREAETKFAYSPVVDGGVLTTAPASLQNGRLLLRCWGTASQIRASVDAIEAAFSQFAYTVTVTLTGMGAEVWQAYTANISVGDAGRWNARDLSAGFQDVEVQYPALPKQLRR